MKAITLWQPWASFIAIGVKPYEIRDWKPPRWLIGKRIAIHAAKKRVATDEVKWAAGWGATDLPLGAVVCTAILSGAYQCGAVISRVPPAVRIVDEVIGSAPADYVIVDDLGDYSERRWAWHLTDIEPLIPAKPASGSQGFWNWEQT